MQHKFTRREFLKAMGYTASSIALTGCKRQILGDTAMYSSVKVEKPVVSVVRIKNDNIDYAVRESIDLLGGINTITANKERIMLKPNLVSPNPHDTTNPKVIEALARLMLESKKDVSIGEGSALAGPNMISNRMLCTTKDKDVLNDIQKSVFDNLGYAELARKIHAPLVNLHTGEMKTVANPKGFVFKEISLHRSLTDTDLLCSVPMMKTHGLAGVTLGMKNLIGVYPGQVYGTVRSVVHTEAAKIEESGTASAIVDMVQVNKLGLVVIDASMAMQGEGPSVRYGGQLVKMDLIIAGTNPLATDMTAAYIMGFEPEEISTFSFAWKVGMTPKSIGEIEIRGIQLNSVKKSFDRPRIIPWEFLKDWWGLPC
jgi:uncharacterized protein (DUF362 family)